MSARHRLDDRTVDALLSGRLPPDSEEFADVADLAMRLRASAEQAPSPRPSPALAELLAGGLPAPVSTFPAHAAGEAARREATVRSRPASRGRSLRRGGVAKVAGLTLLAKLALVTAAVAVTTAGAGYTGALPIPAQDVFDRAFRGGAVPLEVPDGADWLPTEAEPMPPQRDPSQPPTGDEVEGGRAPVPDAPSLRSEVPAEPLQDRAPADAPPVPEPGQRDEQPGSSRDPEPGRDTGSERPEEPSMPDEGGRAEPGPAAPVPEADGPRDGPHAVEPVAPGQDPPTLSADPAGPPTR